VLAATSGDDQKWQKYGTYTKVNKKFSSHHTRAQHILSAVGTVPSFLCATSNLLLMLTARPQDQFPRWRRSRKRLSVCSVLTCPYLWLQCRVSFILGLKNMSFLNRARNSRCTVITDMDTSKRAHRKPSPAAMPYWKLVPWPRSKHEKWTAGSAWETWDSSRCWQCTLCPYRVRIFFITFETAPFFCV
jgi:hypothetical protein